MMKLHLGELRRRGIFKMLTAYALAAWVLIEAASIIAPAFLLPAWTVAAVTTLLVLGTLPVLFLAWRYDLTAKGIERDASHVPDDIDRVVQRLATVCVFVLLAITATLWVHYFRTQSASSFDPTATTQAINSSGLAGSIAILPFDVEGDLGAESSVLALGIQDGLLTSLAKLPNLTVISRTSTERYRNTQLTIPAIGLELNVRRILEGSVQVLNKNMRVNVQLIDVGTDDHVWAKTYDRELNADNVFLIQSDIVADLTSELGTSLSGYDAARLSVLPTHDLDAYKAYLQGIEEMEKVSRSIETAIEYFERATELDPQFALAYAGLGQAYADSSNVAAAELASIAATQAIQLNDELAEAYVAKGYIESSRNNFDIAERAYNKAISLEPSNARAYYYFGKMRLMQGSRFEAKALLERAWELNPNSARTNSILAITYDLNEQYDEAMARYRRARTLDPKDYFSDIQVAATHYLVYGRVDESLFWYYEYVQRKSVKSAGKSAIAIALLELGDVERARYWIETTLHEHPRSFWPLLCNVYLQSYVGDTEATSNAARALFKEFPNNRVALRNLRNVDLLEGREEAAASRYRREYPELFDQGLVEVNERNLAHAVDLALVLQRLGNDELADEILAKSLHVISTMPRLSLDGFWIADVQVHALMGNFDLALLALQSAIDEGWRIKTWYHFNYDPNLEAIRELPEFLRLQELVQEDLKQQAQRVAQYRASGDIVSSELRDYGD